MDSPDRSPPSSAAQLIPQVEKLISGDDPTTYPKVLASLCRGFIEKANVVKGGILLHLLSAVKGPGAARAFQAVLEALPEPERPALRADIAARCAFVLNRVSDAVMAQAADAAKDLAGLRTWIAADRAFRRAKEDLSPADRFRRWALERALAMPEETCKFPAWECLSAEALSEAAAEALLRGSKQHLERLADAIEARVAERPETPGARDVLSLTLRQAAALREDPSS